MSPTQYALAPSAEGVHVSFTDKITVTDDCYPTTITCLPASGYLFPPGVTRVACIATDPAGLSSDACAFEVVVRHIEATSTPGGIKMVWEMPGAALEWSDSVTGPWEEVPDATSPFIVATTEDGKYYRLRFPVGP